MVRLQEIRSWLFPLATEDRNGFHQEILSTSHKGLVAYAWTLIGGAILVLLTRILVVHRSLLLVGAAGLLAVGIVLLLTASQPWSYPYSRRIAISGALTAGVIAVVSTMRLSGEFARLEDFVPLQVSFLVLSLIAFVPILPVQAFLLTAAVGSVYVLWPGNAFAIDILFLSFLAFLSTGLAAVLFRQRKNNYEGFLSTLQATSNLREMQTRLLLSEHAATLGRLSAALSHELNSPVGALQSSVDTLLLLSARMATGGADQERLVRLQSELRKNIQESSRRLGQIVARIQRFSNLDRAEVQEADLNQLLRDVVALAESESASAGRFILDLNPLKPYSCRPAQLSAAFHTLISNALGALGDAGRIEIRTGVAGSVREVVISDDGRGIAAPELAGLFDPSFQNKDGRVRSGNWGMFGARQIIREHGGEIEIRSMPGHGTSARVTLPDPAS